jgi:hypothetical protein
MSEDTNRQARITAIKLWEKQDHSFIEIVAIYNSTFGTKHFPELFNSQADLAYQKTLPGKRTGKEFAKDLQDIFLGDGFFG